MVKIIKPVVLAFTILVSLAAWKGVNALFESGISTAVSIDEGEKKMAVIIQKTDEEWKASLTPEQYRVMRQCGTEPPFSGKYNGHFEKGVYTCAACGALLFRSDTKYDHGTGWPSFTSPAGGESVVTREDDSYSMRRIEASCAACGAHLGHVFSDGPPPHGLHYCINSAALNFMADNKALQDAERSEFGELETAIVAAGCFWGVEENFIRLPGVTGTEVGYTGGSMKNPDYRQVCSDATGHAESVRLTFDPKIVSYEDLVRFFFTIHDPTQINRQGPDVGTQYRSEIFYQDEHQKETGRKIMDEIDASGRFSKPLATRLSPAGEFTRAEEYHQRYLRKNGTIACPG